MTTFNPEEMRKRFHELGRQRQEIVARAAPVRSQYETKLAAVEAAKLAARPVLDELKAIEGPLFDIDQERATISRALGQIGRAHV